MEKIIERAKNLLLNPKVTWETIKLEKTGVKQLFVGYFLILAAVGPVCNIVGQSIVGGRRFYGALSQAIISYILLVGAVYFLAIVVNALAPQFESKKDMNEALKLCVYSSTAAMVSGAFTVIPAFRVLGFLGSLYSLYLLYIGLPVIMKTSRQKLSGYFLTVTVASIVLVLIIRAVTPTFFMTSFLRSLW